MPYLLRSGQFGGQKSLGPLEKLFEIDDYVFCPHKKITSRRTIRNSGALIVFKKANNEDSPADGEVPAAAEAERPGSVDMGGGEGRGAAWKRREGGAGPAGAHPEEGSGVAE